LISLFSPSRKRPRSRDPEPRVIARVLIALQPVLADYFRREILAGTRNPTLARRVREQAHRALELLSDGLAGYGTG
jgi:hypothetical protein